MDVLIKDETFNGIVTAELSVSFKQDEVTVADIIAERVRTEVENYNKKLPEYFNGLVAPTESEKTLNGYKQKKVKPIDAEKQVYIALDAFQKNAFFVLVENKQAETLTQKVILKESTPISFIKLTPLVGG